MQSVAKFVTKAYPVSGCFDYLSEVRTERERSVRVCVCARTHVHTCFSRNSDPALESDVNQERSVYVCVRVHVCVHGREHTCFPRHSDPALESEV